MLLAAPAWPAQQSPRLLTARGDSQPWSPYRVIELLGVEETFQGHVVQPPCSEQRLLPLDQLVRIPTQPDLECFQAWCIYHLSGLPVPVLHHHHCKKFLSYIQSKSIL